MAKKFKSLEEAQKAYDEAAEANENLAKELESKNRTQTTTGAYDVTKTTLANLGPLEMANQLALEIGANLSGQNLLSDVQKLAEQGQNLANTMGLGAARSAELRTVIANTVPELRKLGMEEQAALTGLQNVPKELGINTTIATETLTQLGAVAQFTGKDMGVIAEKFKSVGFNLDQVGQRMADVSNYAKGVGVNVKAVTDGVLTNISKLNTMNFEGGIKGLTKMVAQSVNLGINMQQVLQTADSLMSPEKAIEFSSALQRLGVQSSALLDPLSAMDMALNDPAALQNEMVKISQQFTRLKADGSGFEILPGAKLQLKEVAASMGLTADELANMAIKSSDLEMKMSKIRFPGFAASEEDRTLIANMSQMKGGQAFVQIRNDKTGQMEEVNVENLTAEQIEKLKEEQANQNKSAEQIALDQLTVLEQIDANTAAAKGSVRMGIASAPAIQRMTNIMATTQREIKSSVLDQITTNKTREKVTSLTEPIEGSIVDLTTGGINTQSLQSAMTELQNIPSAILNLFEDVGSLFKTAANKAIPGIEYNIKKEYAPLTGKEPVKGEENITKGALDYFNNLTNVIAEGWQKGREGIDVSGQITVKVEADPNLNTSQLEGAVQKLVEENLFKDVNVSRLGNRINEVNKGDMVSKTQ